MKSLAIIHHSAHGNTERIARLIVEGAGEVTDVRAQLLKAEDLIPAAVANGLDSHFAGFRA